MWGLIRVVCHKCVNIRKLFYYLVIYIVKGNTVMYVTRCYFYCQNNTVDITGGACFISRLLLVVAFYKQTAVGGCGADSKVFFFASFLRFCNFFLEVLSRFFLGGDLILLQ